MYKDWKENKSRVRVGLKGGQPLISAHSCKMPSAWSLIITLLSPAEEPTSFTKNLKQVYDFIQSVRSETEAQNIVLPECLRDLDESALSEHLSLIYNHHRISKLVKVKTFFVEFSQAKAGFNKTVSGLGRSYVAGSKKGGMYSYHNASSTVFKRKPATQEAIENIIMVDGAKKLGSSKLEIEDKELLTYVEGLGYSEVEGIANGTTKAVFKAKNQKGDLVAIKIGRIAQEQKIQMENGINKALGQKMARLLYGGFLQIYKVLTDPENNLVLIQQELASKTLRDIILQKRQKQEPFSDEQLQKVVQDLVQNLYHMHVQNQVAHRDIKPQNIFYTERRYTFGDYGEAEQKNVNVLDSKIRVRMKELKGTPMYMEPRLLALLNRTKLDIQSTTSQILYQSMQMALQSEQAPEYDPFKADVYSLGLVFFELCLHNENFRLDDQIETLFYFKRGDPIFKDLVQTFDLRSKPQKYVLFGSTLYQVPNYLSRMLDPNQSTRISTFQLALMATSKTTILSNILTPFTDIFLPTKSRIDNNPNSNQYNVDYNYKMMTYKGQYVNEMRDGYGNMHRKIVKPHRQQDFSSYDCGRAISERGSSQEEDSQNQDNQKCTKSREQIPRNYCEDNSVVQYSGQWKKDLPNGKGTLRLNDSDNKYKGDFIDGLFFGKGAIYLKDKQMYECQWTANYSDTMLAKPQAFKPGLYRFRLVCSKMNTIFGFHQPSENGPPDHTFALQLPVELLPQAIKAITSQIISVLADKFQTRKLEVSADHLQGFTKLRLFNNNENTTILIPADPILENWLITETFRRFNLSTLTKIGLSRSSISTALEELALKTQCYNLTQINLAQCCYLRERSLNIFLESPIVNGLTIVNLSSTLTSDTTLKIMSNSTYLVRLRQLYLRKCRGFTDDAVKTLLCSKNMKDIEVLDFSYTYVTDGLIQGFTLQKSIRKLRVFKLEGVTLSGQQVQKLARIPQINQVTELHGGIVWFEHLNLFTRLRNLHIKPKNNLGQTALYIWQSNQRINTLKNTTNSKPPAALNTFPSDSSLVKYIALKLEQHKHNKLEVYILKQMFETYDDYSLYFRNLIADKLHKKLVVTCFQKDTLLTVDLMSSQLLGIEIDAKKNTILLEDTIESVLRQPWSNIRKSTRGEVSVMLDTFTINCSPNSVDYVAQALNSQCLTRVSTITLALQALYSSKLHSVKQEMKRQYRLLLEMAQASEKAIATLKPSRLSVNCFFQNDCRIGKVFKTKINPDLIEWVCINGLDAECDILDNSQFPEFSTTCELTMEASLDQTLHALAASECLSHLTRLNLRNRSTVSERGLGYIINSRYCQHIEVLDISGTNVTTNVLTLLRTSDHLALKALHMNNLQEELSFNELKEYIESTRSRNLKKLLIKGCKINQVDAFFLTLTLETIEEIDTDFAGSLQSDYHDLTQLVSKIKYNRLSKISLDLSRCEALPILSEILSVLRSDCLRRVRLNLSSLLGHKRHTHNQISRLIFSLNLSLCPTKVFSVFSINFSRTTIFHNNFFPFLKDRRFKKLKLVFTQVFQNQHAAQLDRCLNHHYDYLTLFELELEKCVGLTNDSLNYFNSIFSRLKKVDHLKINMGFCREIKNWKPVFTALQNLRAVRYLNLGFEYCKIEDETDILCDWISGLEKVKLTLNLTNCWRMRNYQRGFHRLLKLIEFRERFIPKVSVSLKQIKLPIDFRNKLEEISKSSPAFYDLSFDAKQ